MNNKTPLPIRVAIAALVARRSPQQTNTQPRDNATAMRQPSHSWLTAALVGLAAVAWQPTLCRADEPAAADVQDAQIQTRGPVHEAFAGVVTFNPEPGVVVPKAPPEAIEEIPPAERPEGDNVTWIPGYWAWDDDRSDFLWVSGIWRALPPGRQWVPGYWGQTTQGYQWTSGYWADSTAQETTYLPAPPATVEDGPNIAAPSADYGWTPGCWLWRQQRYAWQPGYWAQGRADWDWMPAHYMYTPRGYVFVDGFWDYSVARRGVLFAPVIFDAGVYSRAGFSYTPSLAIDVALFAEQLFLRPNYHHYYFGDYYAPSYQKGGYYAAYAYQSSRFGYDPIFAHQRWEHRQDRGWEKGVEETYQNRRDHENARPPHTWAALKALQANPAEAKLNHAVMVTPVDQLAKQKNGPLHFQTVPQADRQKLATQGQEVQKSRDQRRTLEAKGVAPAVGKPGAAVAPTTAKLPKSPIMGKPAAQLKKGEMPPALPRAPKADLNVQPKPATPGVAPEPRKPGVVPEPPKPGVMPEPRKPGVVPDPPKPGVMPEPRKPEVTPTPRKPEVTPTPTPRKPEVMPEPRKPEVMPEPRKPEVTPTPIPRKPEVMPEPRKPEVTPVPRKPEAAPEPRKPEAAPAPRKPEGVPDKKDRKEPQ